MTMRLEDLIHAERAAATRARESSPLTAQDESLARTHDERAAFYSRVLALADASGRLSFSALSSHTINAEDLSILDAALFNMRQSGDI
jgi:hypothetical protein